MWDDNPRLRSTIFKINFRTINITVLWIYAAKLLEKGHKLMVSKGVILKVLPHRRSRKA